MKTILLRFGVAVLLALVSVHAMAQTLQLGSNWYGIDNERGLIVSNQDTYLLNLMYSDGADVLMLDGQEYTFNTPADTLVVGYPYTVNRGGKEYVFYFTELPLIHIDMEEEMDTDERRPAQFRMTETNGNEIQSNAGLNYRGAFSLIFPKKSMRLEFWLDPEGSRTRNIQLLDLRSDDDWILLAQYNEPLRIRNRSCHELWSEIHTPHYATQEPDALSGSRGRHVEIFRNGSYMGVYLLTERIDRKQLKINSWEEGSDAYGELHKAKDWGSGTVLFSFLPFYNNQNRWFDGYQKKYPREEEHTDWSDFFDMKAFVMQTEDTVFTEDINAHFHTGNAVDYFLFLNFLRAEDNTGKNIFIARTQPGAPYFYVPWDLDAVLGYNYDGTILDETEDILSNGLYDRFLDACEEHEFASLVQERWFTLREGVLHTDSMMARMQGHHDNLYSNGVYYREEMAWPEYSYEPDVLQYTRNWLEERVAYLDDFIGELCEKAASVERRKPHGFRLYPNPTNGSLGIFHYGSGDYSGYQLRDIFGRLVKEGRLNLHTTFIQLDDLIPGTYLFTVDGDPSTTQKVIRF